MDTSDFDPPLFAFNWLTAGLAHPQWLTDAVPAVLSRGWRTEPRLVRQLSRSLLQRHGLSTRHACRLDVQRWVLWRPEALEAAALEVGAAMLSVAVCMSIDGCAVEQWDVLLGGARRQRALTYAARFPALSRANTGWCPEDRVRRDVFCLGASMLAASLTVAEDGLAERFRLRFADGALTQPVCLDDQRGEIERLLAQAQAEGVLDADAERAAWH
jgi:YOP proteins translocation protein K (YscK)